MRKVLSFFIVALVAVSSTSSAFAQDEGVASVTVTSDGELFASIDNAVFESVEYGFVDETTNAVVTVNVEDNTGSGEGWNVSMSGTDFTTENEANPGFSADNLSLGAGSVESTAGQEPDGISAPGITLGETEQTIASAGEGQGLGHYTIEYPGTLNVPGGTLPGDYQSTLTININSGP